MANKEKNNKQDNGEQPVDLSVYTDALAETYEPAGSPDETTHWFTTEEVAAAIINKAAEMMHKEGGDV